ncbi:uncharacterized protein LOC143424631 isoform X1 [Xylocopa sonorina]|uniref:uncharacterized protein LOC143424631 isoform X1 n=1 Tax=Xylocopa sonorina TaxID=1818115 RepID=UPI00403A82E8
MEYLLLLTTSHIERQSTVDDDFTDSCIAFRNLGTFEELLNLQIHIYEHPMMSLAAWRVVLLYPGVYKAQTEYTTTSNEVPWKFHPGRLFPSVLRGTSVATWPLRKRETSGAWRTDGGTDRREWTGYAETGGRLTIVSGQEGGHRGPDALG